MNQCPYCKENTIKAWQKFKASDLYPAICSSCGKGSRMSVTTNAIEGLAGTILFPVILVFSFLNKSWLPVIIFAVLLMLGSVLKLVYLPMVAVNEKAVVKKYWFAFGALVMLLVWLVYDGFIK
jgi:hypothetical protein